MDTNQRTFAHGWTLDQWRRAYLGEGLELEVLLELVAGLDASDPAWISIAPLVDLEAELGELRARRERAGGSLAELPLYGVPYAVKDNIDVLGFATTAACPEFAYRPQKDATVVARLRAAGAVVIGKTNLDQFATGLVGTRSPYGTVPSCFDSAYIGGGSSSGSAAVVALGIVPFSLGTDTAGSGRVPAAFQNVVGIKPTLGRLSTRGVVPACKSLDCVSVFALTVDDAARVADLIEGPDAGHPYSRTKPLAAPRLPSAPWRIGVPSELEFFGDELARQAFEASLRSIEKLDVSLVPLDFAPFRALARLLYEGPWVAERLLAIGELLDQKPEAINEVVRGIVEGGTRFSALDAFAFEYQRAELAATIDVLLRDVDALLVPTTATTFRISEIASAPVAANSQLGTYTNYTNLADLSALALPGCFRADGLPSGLSLLAPAWHDDILVRLARRFQEELALPLGATGLPFVPSTSAAPASGRLIAVLGAHLDGMALNGQLTTRGATLVERTCTSASYRFFILPGTKPPKPGLLRGPTGAPIELELWSLPNEEWGNFLGDVPSPLAIGSIELCDGRWVKGFVCESGGLEGALEITSFGGYRAYMASLAG